MNKTETKTKKITKIKNKSKNQMSRTEKPTLRFSPTAWAKLLYFRDKTDNEIGGFGITEADDLLYVTDFAIVKQQVTAVSIKFDDEAVADFFEDQVDLGRKPEQFARIWLHTHPGSFAEPSAIDEDTFKKVFGNCQWAVMAILAQDNRTYARLSFNVGPGGQMKIPVQIDYAHEFGPSEKEKWDAEYQANITVDDWMSDFGDGEKTTSCIDLDSFALPYDFLDDFEAMTPAERQYVLDELATRPELWNEESEVMYI